MKKVMFGLIASLFILMGSQAFALDAYTDAQKEDFTSWCTGAKSTSEPICNCALKQVMQTVAPATLTSFLANGGKVSFSGTGMMAAASVTQALTSCSK